MAGGRRSALTRPRQDGAGSGGCCGRRCGAVFASTLFSGASQVPLDGLGRGGIQIHTTPVFSAFLVGPRQPTGTRQSPLRGVRDPSMPCAGAMGPLSGGVRDSLGPAHAAPTGIRGLPLA